MSADKVQRRFSASAANFTREGARLPHSTAIAFTHLFSNLRLYRSRVIRKRQFCCTLRSFLSRLPMASEQTFSRRHSQHATCKGLLATVRCDKSRNSKMRQSVRVLLYALTFCFLQPHLSAQITDVTSVQSPPIPGADHGYVQMLNETVNPSNGALSVRINVPVPSGRHLTVPFGFGYDSHTSNFISAQGYAGSNSYLSAGGWSYLVPHLDYQHKDVSYYEQWLNGAPVG